MTPNHYTATTNTAASELNILPYIEGLIAHRKVILLAALIGIVVSAIIANQSPYLFESNARVNIIDIEDAGGVSPDDRRAPEMLTLVEHGFILGTTKDNYNEVMLARLRSREFTVTFIDKHNLYPAFYPEKWDSNLKQWEPGFSPDRGEVFTRFRDQVVTIDQDEITKIVSVKMQWHDAEQARTWANLYVSEFNEYIRQRVLVEVERKLDFLNIRLRNTDVVEIQQSIYRLIEAQTAIAMLANSREEYALEIIDPAALPFKSFTMSRKRKTVIGGVACFLFASFLSMFYTLVRELLNTFQQFRRQHPRQTA